MTRFFSILKAWQSDQQGAVALLMLASLLVTFMFALVVHDVGWMAEDKMEVQIAADTASWSQSAVEARAMNIIAFANVGKRVTVGMVSYYEGLWIGVALLTAAMIVLTIACWVAAIFVWALVQTCTKLSFSTAEIISLVANEFPDLMLSGGLGPDLMTKDTGYFQKDVEGFTKYQAHINEIAPFWSWGENFIRGFRNGAITSGWPVPPADSAAANALGGFLSNIGVPDGSGFTDGLPVVVNTDIDKDKAYNSMCRRIYGGSSSSFSKNGNVGGIGGLLTDQVIHTIDYGLKSLIGDSAKNTMPSGTTLLGSADRRVFLFLMGVMNFGFIRAGCSYNMKDGSGIVSAINSLPGVSFPEPFGQTAWPFTIQDTEDAAGWLRLSSNLTIAYRRGINRGDAKYDSFTDDGVTLGAAEQLQGVWALSRSEITYQNASDGTSVAPDLWHSSWTARMRPVALPGEWSGVKMSSAFRDAAPWMIRGLAVDAIIGQGVGIDSAVDGLRMGLGTMEMNDNMDGVAK